MDINYLAVTKNYPDLYKCSVTVIGLGYVGLPLAVEFGKRRNTIGFDINKQRIIELQNGFDITKEKNKGIYS